MTQNNITKKELNKWLKNNIPFKTKVLKERIDQFIIGCDTQYNLHEYSIKIKKELNVKDIWGPGFENYLTLNF